MRRVTLVQSLELAAAAMAAGAMNAIAGGGTLVTFPTLILLGTGSEVANATSTLALMAGTAGSMYGYREHARAIRSWLARFWLVSVVGGLIGAVLLTRTSDATFSKMVPFLILFATVLFVAQDAFRRFGTKTGAERKGGGRAVWGAIAVSIRGRGLWRLFRSGDRHPDAGVAWLPGDVEHPRDERAQDRARLADQPVATLWFIPAGLIDWPKAGIMTAGALAGYYLAAHYSQRIPQHRVRQLVSAIGFGISGVMFYKQFVK